MGLDMYLSVRKYVSRINFEKGYDDQNGWSENPEFREILNDTGMLELIEPDESAGAYIEVPVMYWRKVNAVHKWFVDTLADGVDECQPISVGIHHMRELVNLCDRALKDAENPDEYLPTESGFFFGGIEYDEWYWEGIRYTRDRMSEVISLMEKHGLDWGQYQASW